MPRINDFLSFWEYKNVDAVGNVTAGQDLSADVVSVNIDLPELDEIVANTGKYMNPSWLDRLQNPGDYTVVYATLKAGLLNYAAQYEHEIRVDMRTNDPQQQPAYTNQQAVWVITHRLKKPGMPEFNRDASPKNITTTSKLERVTLKIGNAANNKIDFNFVGTGGKEDFKVDGTSIFDLM